MAEKRRKLGQPKPRKQELPQCNICRSSKWPLTKHHITPKKVGGTDYVTNLAMLCEPCHALVERYYWRHIAQSNPTVAGVLKQIMLDFKNGVFQEKAQREAAIQLQADAWTKLLETPFNWLVLYNQACTWAKSVKALRYVSVRDAITADPWWVPR